MKYGKCNKGFSLIELIIVIAIMAVLVAIIAPNLSKYLGKSKVQTDKRNLDEIHTQVLNCISDARTRENEIMIMLNENPNGSNSAIYEFKLDPATGKTVAVAVNNGIDEFADLMSENVKHAKTASKQDRSKKVIRVQISGSSSEGYIVTEAFSN